MEKITDPTDMEDPQAGEVLPPMLLEAWYAFCIECSGLLQHRNPALADLIKFGMELSYQQLKPYMQAALPHYEAGVRDTRMRPADAGKLAELARYKEIAEYVK